MNYIYVLIDPRTSEVRYVGKSNQPKLRYNNHCSRATNLKFKGYKNPHLSNWVRLLNGLGLKPEMKIIDESEGLQWREKEKFWIREYKNQGCRLINLTEGGDSPPINKRNYTTEDPMIRFWKKVICGINKNDCWIWLGRINTSGYGIFYESPKHNKANKSIYTHRWAYQQLKNEIPNNKIVTWSCNNKRCVNPNHLVLEDLMTLIIKVNQVKKMSRVGYTNKFCPKGHEYTENNIQYKKNKCGGLPIRACRECNRIYARKRRKEKKNLL